MQRQSSRPACKGLGARFTITPIAYVDTEIGVWFDMTAASRGLYGLMGRKTGQN
jgi:hypothetical protein